MIDSRFGIFHSQSCPGEGDVDRCGFIDFDGEAAGCAVGDQIAYITEKDSILFFLPLISLIFLIPFIQNDRRSHDRRSQIFFLKDYLDTLLARANEGHTSSILVKGRAALERDICKIFYVPEERDIAMEDDVSEKLC